MDGFATLDGETLAIGLNVENAGVGPTRVERMTLTGRVLTAGAAVRPFELRYPADETDDAIEVLDSLLAGWSAEVCYCSTLGQCWLSGNEGGSPFEVGSCDDQPGGAF